VLNANDGSPSLRPGAFFQVSGQNLASSMAASQAAPPTVLGGSCVTFSDMAAPLLQTSAGRIIGQVPAGLTPGPYVLQVRSLATGQQSDPVLITVQKAQ
jgi:uncharacterized protein (TIGR03437 family)